jgi:hypothetical protein
MSTPPRALPSQPARGKVLTDFIGLCFICFRYRHVAKDCLDPSCCLHYREPNHLASTCHYPRVALGDVAPHRVGRKRPSSLAMRHAPHRGSTRRHTRSSAYDATPTASSCSTNSGPILSKNCKTPSDSSPPRSLPPSPLDLPVRAPGHRLPVELCVLHRSKEVDSEERDLNYALVAIVGGTRPAVSVANVRSRFLD